MAQYSATFNPARVKPKAMRAEMPVRHWPTLPETRIIDELIEQAPQRVAEMVQHPKNASPTAVDLLPDHRDLPNLRAAARKCEACPLHADASQTVFGEGPADAKLVLVGEQPGDEEDRAGRPFVGPAGRLLDEILKAAEIDREKVYLTNAVKHFGYVRGYRIALHYRSSQREVQAALHEFCRSRIEAEAFRADVSRGTDVERMFESVHDRFSRLDVLVTAASIWNAKMLEDLSAEDLRLMVCCSGYGLAAGLLVASHACRDHLEERQQLALVLNRMLPLQSRGNLAVADSQ